MLHSTPPCRACSASATPAHPPTCVDAADYTNTFRSLSSISPAGADGPADVDAASGLPPALAAALGPLEEVGGRGVGRVLVEHCMPARKGGFS